MVRNPTNLVQRAAAAVAARNLPKPAPALYEPSNLLTDGVGELVVESLNGLRPKPVRWLVRGRIPAGMMGLIAGEGGHGKSMTTLELAAAVSVGRCAFGLEYPGPVKGKALLVSCEDDWERTIAPRLATLGANFSNILRVKGVKVTPDGRESDFHMGHFRELERLLAADSAIRLVTIDPAGAYIGRAGVNDSKDSDLRAVLGPLSEAANRTGASVLLVKHLNKSAGVSAVQRVSGSAGYINAVRFAYLVAPDPDDAEHKLMLAIKANVLPAGTTGMAYRMEPIPEDEGTAILLERWPDLDATDLGELASQLFRQRWESDVTADANEVTRGGAGKGKAKTSEQAAEWLAPYFAEHGVAYSSDAIKKAAGDAGFGRNAVFEAGKALKESIGLRYSNVGRCRGAWHWGTGDPAIWQIRTRLVMPCPGSREV